MYKPTNWLDHATTKPGHYVITVNPDGSSTIVPAGEVVQQGTNLSAVNFNNMENGITDATAAAAILAFALEHHMAETSAHNAMMDSEVLGELINVTLTNTAKYPFNSTSDVPVSVPLATVRKNLSYTVEPAVESFTGGYVGNVSITEKALNGFKISFDGSAKSVTISLRVKGGMT